MTSNKRFKMSNLISKIVNLPYMGKLVPHPNLEKTYKYWGSPYDDANKPICYLIGEERSKALLDIFNRFNIEKESKILELGCNVGRNLNFLYNEGFKNLYGIEINTEAIQLMKKHYPEMSKIASIYNTTIEEKIKEFGNGFFDVVFTMAVLMHIHPKSEMIFSEMSRITNKYLVTMEVEKGVARRNYERNYKLVFEKLGMKEIASINCNDNMIPDPIGNSVARVFVHRRLENLL